MKHIFDVKIMTGTIQRNNLCGMQAKNRNNVKIQVFHVSH